MTAKTALAIGTGMLLVLGYVDYASGYELSLSIFYLLPIMFTAWYGGRRPAMLLAVLSACVWLMADITAGHEYSRVFYFIWDMVMRLGFLLVLAYFITENRILLEHERALARTDALTGVANRRAFLEALEAELKRVARYGRPMSLAYLDVDDFKRVNDTQGHDAGDRLLRSVTVTMRARVRSTDLIGRLGGDEFAVLMPETEKREALEVVEDVRARLLDAMKAENWTSTFSIGAVTCLDGTCSVADLIRIADGLMYDAKKTGKNSVRQEAIRGSAPAERPSTLQGEDRHA